MGRPTLEQLAIKYNSDKYYSHSYIPFYASEFYWLRDGCINLLEIGIGYRDLMQPFVPEFIEHSSIKMWREYFDPEAMIYACDIRPDVLPEDMPNVRAFVLDQSNIVNLWQVSGPFDIIIDDGSHEVEHQILTAAVLVPQLRSRGIYIIEDVRDPFKVASALGGEIHKFEKRPDDCLVVVRK